MYTWGCGWHGQTGQGNWNNVTDPKLLKVQAQKDAKFIMASCGAKHTMALDSNGNLWFFGHKLAIGISSNESSQSEKQL
jgi:alpha-tubulin suppressor-like RCC1 family protein